MSAFTLPLAHAQLYLTLCNLMPAGEAWRNVTNTTTLWAIRYLGLASLLGSALTVACIWPRKRVAFCLASAAVGYNIVIIFLTGPIVVHGPLHLIATGIWILVATNTYRAAKARESGAAASLVASA